MKTTEPKCKQESSFMISEHSTYTCFIGSQQRSINDNFNPFGKRMVSRIVRQLRKLISTPVFQNKISMRRGINKTNCFSSNENRNIFNSIMLNFIHTLPRKKNS
ncbi:hypothetical protein KFK09_023887 [Dendrobium nobile]|uniref:Uncharacterized protein n=1 Tax=Dendrobium nobile TaxID=94219 RepID=A0A8T3ADA2_DENNO|nr:hypothetical protein KFK09_023887 [Dendrobium nobile]